MDVVSFYIKGKMAHFRKYYSNSTALTYVLPPVTTIKGIIAGLLGYERDSYYDIFSNNRTKIAISIASPIKKIVQKMNLLKIERLNDLNGSHKDIRTQTNTEWVIPYEIRNGEISYRVILWHSDTEMVKKIEYSICNKKNYYLSKGISVALGSAQCLGWIEDGKIIKCYKKISDDKTIYVNSAIVKDIVESIDLSQITKIQLGMDENITEFSNDRRLTINSKKELLFSLNAVPIPVKLIKGVEYIQVEGENMVFIG